MACRFCKWFCDRFCPKGFGSEALWDISHQWDEDYASQWDEWQDYSDAVEASIEEAQVQEVSEPEKALTIYRHLADDGVIWAMNMCGWHYKNGVGTPIDSQKALDYFYKGLTAGSWKSTLYYSNLLFRMDEHDSWPAVLQDGIDREFIPSFFWMAWYRYKVSPNRKTARNMKPLLEKASKTGHPGARLLLARWTFSGKFGLRAIPEGFRMLLAIQEPMEDRTSVFHNGKQAANDQEINWEPGN